LFFALYFESSKLDGVKWQVFAGSFVGVPIWDGAASLGELLTESKHFKMTRHAFVRTYLLDWFEGCLDDRIGLLATVGTE
jgi:hypothetical protein